MPRAPGGVFSSLDGLGRQASDGLGRQASDGLGRQASNWFTKIPRAMATAYEI